MRRKLVVTLSTVHGTRQITLSQITRYFVLTMLLTAAVAFWAAYYLLFQVSESLETLEQEHQALNSEFETLNYELEQVSEQRDQIQARYDVVLGSQRLYLGELDTLNERLIRISQERENLLEQTDALSEQLSVMDQVEASRDSLEAENQALLTRLEELSLSLGLGALSDEVPLEEQANLLEAAARERLFLMHAIPNGSPGEAERINSRFGNRIHPVTGKQSMHRGIDLKMAIGTPVYATADGIVEMAGNDTRGGFGKLIRIQHAFGFKTYYAHLSKIQVKVGQYIHKGQQIGLSGNTGRSTGPHLHYEVRKLWTAIDPEPFIRWSLTSFDQLFIDVTEVDWESLGKLYPLQTVKKAM